ncbi:MAG: response regulator [Lachnospiraceae bacterium]|nr:response regulator [Lachnospiraceae bacterium]
MEDYVISYDISSLAMLIIFLFYFFTKKRFASRINHVFELIVYITCAMIVCDLLGVLTLAYRDRIPLWCNYVVQGGYHLFQHFGNFVFTYYIILITNKEGNSKRNKRLTMITFIPAAAVLLITLSNPFTKLVFYFDDELNYNHGPFMPIALGIAIVYFIFDIAKSISARNRLSFKKRITAILFVVMVFSGVILQWLFPRYLLTGIGCTMGLVCVYLSQQNPNDTIDTRTNLFNRRAFSYEVDRLITQGNPFKVVGAVMLGFAGYNEKYGFVRTDELFVSIAHFLNTHFGEHHVFSLGNDSFAVIAEKTDCEEIIKMISGRLSSGFKVKGDEVAPGDAYCIVSFPDDASTTRHLVNMIDLGLEVAAEEGGGAVLDVRTYADIKDRKISQLENRQKKLEEMSKKMQQEKEDAQKSEQSKTLFLAQMAPEIRTPMTAILGMTEIIARDTKEKKIKEYAASLQNSGRALLTIINDILDYSKIEAGKFEIVETEYYFASSIYNAMNTIQVRAAEKNIEIYAEVDPTIPSVMLGDEIRARQILMNILSNAVKYTEKGSVTINAGWTRTGDICNLRISVTDTGIGIKKENLGRLFDDFDRFDTERNKAIEGSGLGLAIVKQLLKLMNGKISVESEYGFGSTFTFTLPQKIIDDTPSVRLEDPERFKLLIYDGRIMERKSTERAAKLLGVEYESVSGSDEFMRRQKEDSFTHLIVGTSEYETLASIKDDPRLVVIANEKYFDKDGRQIMYLSKPVFTFKLAILLEEHEQRTGIKKNASRPFIANDAKLLIVDDNGVNLEICAGLLKNHQMMVDFADSGDKCLALTKNKKYDLIFLDHMMPGKDGIETLNLLRGDPSNENVNTPVVAFTANAVSGMKEMFKKNGFDEFLSKPIDIAKMDDILIRFLDHRLIEFVDEYDTDDDEEETVVAAEPLLPHMDMDSALANCGGSMDILVNLLKIVYADGKKKLPLIEKYREEGDIANYTIEVHALKTTCANIGYREMSEKAKALEAAGRNEDRETIDRDTPEILKEYEELLSDIEKLESRRESVRMPSGDAGSFMTLQDKLAVLRALLRDYETDVAEKILECSFSSEESGIYRDRIEEIRGKMELYDYDGAQEVIEDIMSDLDK